MLFSDQDVNDKLSPDQFVNGTDPSSQEFEKSSTSFAGKHVITVRDSHHAKSLKKGCFLSAVHEHKLVHCPTRGSIS